MMKRKINLYLLTASLILIASIYALHFNLARQYIQNLVEHRSEEDVDRLWQKITVDVESINKDAISIFYLTYDDYYMAEWGLRFGFSSRAAIHYDIREQKYNPYLIYEYDDLLSIVKDGKAMEKQGVFNVDPIPLNQIYAFDLRNAELTNITDEIRQKLTEDLVSAE